MIPIVRGSSQEANVSSLMKGWVVGHMHEGLTHTREFEIKHWHYDRPFEYGKKRFDGTEFIVIYGGILRFETEWKVEHGTETAIHILKGNHKEYIIFPPGITKTVIVVEAPAFGVTVRWPSAPGVNQVVQK